MRQSVCTLDEALDYRNDEVIRRFIGLYDMPFAEAGALFRETKKWLWLAATAHQENGPKLVIDKHVLFIDEMWHNFILFTKEYAKYCAAKFGFFIHHNPTPYKEKLAIRAEIEADPLLTSILARRRWQYSYIYDKLGANTLELWYGTLSDKYTPQYLNSIRQL